MNFILMRLFLYPLSGGGWEPWGGKDDTPRMNRKSEIQNPIL